MFIVDTLEKFSEALEFIRGSKELAYDVETDGLNTRQNRIIGFGVSNGLDGFYVPCLTYVRALDKLVPMGLSESYVKALLEELNKKRLLTFNGAFDLPFTKSYFGTDLLPALHCDVMLLKHTCDEEFPFGLKEIATKLWGTDVKKEKEELAASIKANGGTAKEYYKADTGIIAKYCVQDTLLTHRLYRHYSKVLRDQNLEKFFYDQEVMPLYKEVVMPMERRGLALDMPLLLQSQTEITQDMSQLIAQIMKQLEPHLSLFYQWFKAKDYPFKPTGRLARLMKKHDLTFPEAQEKAMREDFRDQHPFNLQSKHHLKKLFFDTLDEEPLSKTDKGNPQVDDGFLDEMSKKYDWCKDLQILNKLSKLKGTYIDRLLEEQEDGILYPRFLLHRTVSGRLAGDLQQLPRPIDNPAVSSVIRKYNNRIRAFMLARPGHVLIGADYEQLEPSIFAHTSGDGALQDIFTSGKDFYSEVAIKTERLVGVSSDKKAENYLGLTHKSKRQKAKAYALGIAYGMTGYKLQFELEIPQEEADRLVRDYLNAFPALERWMNASKDNARNYGQVKTEAGRVRHLPQVMELHSKYGASIGDSLALWKRFHEVPGMWEAARQDHKTYKNLLNNSINFQVQGLAASIVNRASIAIARKLKTEQLSAALISQIHDELLYEVPESQIERTKVIIQETMQNIVQLSVPLRAVPKIGSCYKDCK